jgi:biopolymer transport protein ExbB
MKRIALITLGWLLAAWIAPGSLPARDMRQIQTEARQVREALAQKAAAEKRAAEAAAAESRARIMADRQRLEDALKNQEARVRRLGEAISALGAEAEALDTQEAELTEKLSETDAMVRELVGVVRINAKDIDALVSRNLQTAFLDEDTDYLQAIAEQSRFPDMAALERMADLIETAIQTSGEVTLRPGTIIDRGGRSAEADILAIGNFTAAYRLGEEIGYLNDAPAGRQLFALSHLPPKGTRKRIAAYMDGESDSVPMDISRGAALHQLSHALSLRQQIPKGGPIVWPILAVLALGVLIVAERVVHLSRKRTNAEALVQRIEGLMRHRQTIDCAAVFQGLDGKPVARVLRAGLECCRTRREELENALQEAILKEIPPMERFLSTLGLLAAIAPLLGLLGTVTGMIDTFHVITLHGTGDPRMMSGGISEALVTTMLGLTVAIPLMLAHTLLNRTVENRISQMEEKAVALVNLVDRHCGAETAPPAARME